MSSIRVVAASLALVLGVGGAALSGARAFPLQVAAAQPGATAIQTPPRDPLSPESHHLQAARLFEKIQKNATLTPDAKATALKDMVEAEDRALAINPDYVPSLIYKNLALRMQATMTTDPQEQQALVREADELREKALALRRAAGIPDPPFAKAAAPPPSPAYQEALDRLHPMPVGGQMLPPVKTHDVKPVYPPDAKAAGIQGVVIIEAIVNAEGRIEDARVLKSVPQLDAAAVEAVRQWEYVPTLMNGQAVPVVMTVTVNFTLQ